MEKIELTERERQEVEHWRRWCEQGGRSLVSAPMALKPLIAILDRIAPRADQQITQEVK